MENDHLHTVPKIIRKFAESLGTEVNKHRLDIPEKFGKGYCRGYIIFDHIRMLILQYELKTTLVIDNPEFDPAISMILFKFQNVIPEKATASAGSPARADPSVLVATSSMHTDVTVPIHSNNATINIEVDPNYLKGLLPLSGKSPVLQTLLQNKEPFLFDQIIYPSLQKILDEIVAEPVDESFILFFLKVKAEELICRLLMELDRRDEKRLYALNSQDVQTIYKAKEEMLKHLDKPPVIQALAADAKMSPTKLKRLFKQIFGDSIFSYYQEFRMKEAARLLTLEKLSVSDVGYKLGFTNLSHFTRVFEQHMGIKPKKYSTTMSGY
jgi:AraC-like DNA-binding protein